MPGSSGMQSVCKGAYPGQTSITLIYANDRHEPKWPKLYLFNPKICLCGNQVSQCDPGHYLWPAPALETQIILPSEPHSLVIRLGFLAEMTFWGCIGHVSCLDLVSRICLRLCTLPAQWHTHTLSGKAVGKAIRGHARCVLQYSWRAATGMSTSSSSLETSMRE